MERGNFFAQRPDASAAEVIEQIASFSGGRVRVERICSDGQTTPPDSWYDQAWAEWVVVLEGGAELTFADPHAVETLDRGDWLLIPAHRKHRVTRTAPGTLWLAVHGDADDSEYLFQETNTPLG